MWFALLSVGLACCGTSVFSHEDVGPWYEATKGELFPRAQVRTVGEDFLTVQSEMFQFNTIGKSCDMINEAMDRYKLIMMNDARIARKVALPNTFIHHHSDVKNELATLDIDLVNPCEQLPHLHMNEKYTLKIDASTKSAVLRAKEVWGILRGLESFSQLIAASSDGNLIIKAQEIEDSPRFPHRGLLLDTSRHYLPVSDILMTLDAMSYNKLNVFHWHITDDNSFPYVSKVYPELSDKGAYHHTMVYTPSDVQKIVEYGRLRGIRVMVEFDTPAHSKSVAPSHPEILTKCYKRLRPNGKLGPMNPIKPELWNFLDSIFAELMQVFPDRYIHLGGDEINFDCWSSNPDIVRYMKKHGYKKGDFDALESEYFKKLLTIPKKTNVSSIVWQEVYQHVTDLPTETVVQIWTGSWKSLMRDVVSKKHPAILSACWYLSDILSGGDWTKFYECDPTDFIGTSSMKKRVLGGEACMWGEYVDTMNVHQRVWPRASAAAERLWSYDTESNDEVAKRLEEHSCRMNRRGVPAQPPNGAGFCVL